MSHRTSAPRVLSIVLASSALWGCGAGEPAHFVSPLLAPRDSSGEPRITVLTVAGSAPEVLGPFDCAQGIDVRSGGRRYCLYNHTSSWPDAETHCVEHGGHLATISSPDVGSTLFQAIGFSQSPPTFWIGLAEPAEGRWLWASGAQVSFTAWNPGEPSNSGGNENCAEWLFAGARWNDIDCALPRGFLCETRGGSRRGKSNPACAREVTAFGSTYCLNTSAPATWEQAQHTCTAAGGNLAVLDTEEKNQAIAGAFGARFNQATGSLWLGLNDRAREGDFRWVNGEPVGHTAWRAGEPNNVGDEDCAEWSPGDGLWNDLSCAAQLGSLCEAP